MNYNRIYQNLMAKFANLSKDDIRSEHNYSEAHHINPRCLGGTDDVLNIVNLTAKAHFIAHYLLIKIHPDNRDLWCAFNLMAGQTSKNHARNYKVSSRVYELCKLNLSRLGIPQDRRSKISKTLKGRKLTDEHKANMIAARIGSKRSEETKKKMKEAQQKWRSNYEITNETREKMRVAKLGKPGPRKGVIVSDESREKMRISARNRKYKSIDE